MPTYGLTDNEKTVTSEHVAGIPVRNAQMLEFCRHYGLTIATCVPADPASKGGWENAVKIAKADLVPTEANLLADYASFAELQSAVPEFCEQVNNRPHRVTRRAPAEMLAEERARLHPLPEHPYTAAFGVTRTVPAQHPDDHLRARVVLGAAHLGRADGVGAALRRAGRDRACRRCRPGRGRPPRSSTTPGTPRVADAHFPPQPEGPLGRTPRPKTGAEEQFLALGEGAALWLTEAAAAGCSRIRAKMAEAVDLAALHDRAAVDRALGPGRDRGPVRPRRSGRDPGPSGRRPRPPQRTEPARAGEHNSLAQGTGGWARLGEQEAN